MLPNTINIHEAVYNDEEVTDYTGNPLIEALPKELAYSERYTRLQYLPKLPTETERAQAPHHRYHYVGRLRQIIFALPEYSLFEPSIAMMIRQGYISRNPLSDVARANLWRANGALAESRELPVPHRAADTILFCGHSGTGKTTFIERVLSEYPQIIQHTRYKGQELRVRQISWLKVNCPKEGTPTALCKNFFAAIDKILGTDHAEQAHSRYTSTDYMNKMGRIASTNLLGVLVLDELQNLSVSASGGENKLLDQLAVMFECLQIPIIFIGTPPVTKLFERQLQNVRRSASLGCHYFERPASHEEEGWKEYLANLWKYQWTKKFQPLTDPLSKLFYDHCQGLTFFAVALFAHCQFRLIDDDDDEAVIDESLIKDIANNELKILQPILAELRKNDPSGYERFENMMTSFSDHVSLISRTNAPPRTKGTVAKAVQAKKRGPKLGSRRKPVSEDAVKSLQQKGAFLADATSF